MLFLWIKIAVSDILFFSREFTFACSLLKIYPSWILTDENGVAVHIYLIQNATFIQLQSRKCLDGGFTIYIPLV